jgi:predicted phage terminase large subunit-like protein
MLVAKGIDLFPWSRSEGEALWPELEPGVPWFDEEELAEIRGEVGEQVFCTPAETPILMADRTTKPICEVKPGDVVMGFVQAPSPTGGRGGGSGTRLTPTVVEHVRRKRGRVDTLVMGSGLPVRCTPEHRWFTGRNTRPEPNGHVRKPYAPAKVGSHLYRFDVVLPELTPARQRDLDWMAGIIDGEGHIADSFINIAQSPDSNPAVFAAIGACLDRLGWSYALNMGTHNDSRPRHGHGKRIAVYIVHDPRAVFTELIRRTNIAKINQLRVRMERRPHKPTRFRDRVESIVEGVEEDVYALQTGTGNYVAWGYASSNSGLYQQEPHMLTGDLFKIEDWKRLDALPAGKLTFIRRWDIAATEGGGDWTAGALLAMDAQRTVYVVDVRRCRRDPLGVERFVHETAVEDKDRFGDQMRVIRVEREPGSSGKMVETAWMRTVLSGFHAEFLPATGSKRIRALPFSAQQKAGNVYMVRTTDSLGNPTAPDWFDWFPKEAAAFTGDQSGHDDAIDAACAAYVDLIELGPRKRPAKLSSARTRQIMGG